MASCIGQRLADETTVEIHWDAGRVTNEHVLFNRQDANYGGQIGPRLARFLETDRGILYKCLQFYRAFPIVCARTIGVGDQNGERARAG